MVKTLRKFELISKIVRTWGQKVSCGCLVPAVCSRGISGCSGQEPQ